MHTALLRNRRYYEEDEVEEEHPVSVFGSKPAVCHVPHLDIGPLSTEISQ